jgi:signal transduction histidine kinase
VPPPPLTRWQTTWRYLVAFALSAAIWGEVAAGQWRDHPVAFWLEVLAGVVSFVAYGYRRRYPLLVTSGLIVVSALSSLAVGPALMALVSLSTRRVWREIIVAGTLNTIAGSVFFTAKPIQGSPWVLSTVINLLGTGVLVAIGMYIGARRELVTTLRDRADRAEREQALRLSQARASERARIAREMHDVLAHRISLVAMHAGALEFRKDLTPKETADVAGVIRDNAHQALADLREVLGVLRDDEPADAPVRPQPTLRDLDDLITDEVRAGARIRVRNRVQHVEEVPESVGRNAYRIVQECLTNARKHAPHSDVDLILAGRPGRSLVVVVRNHMPVGTGATTPGAGLGLVGLAERAELSGGRLTHSIRRGKHFLVTARLPWPA